VLGPHLIGDKSLTGRADMARIASGIDGKCVDYVKGVADKLTELEIDDQAVQEFLQAV